MALDKRIQKLFKNGMKRGLVIGKFMPIHNGHIALMILEIGAWKCLICLGMNSKNVEQTTFRSVVIIPSGKKRSRIDSILV
jgi:hypothetical protein